MTVVHDNFLTADFCLLYIHQHQQIHMALTQNGIPAEYEAFLHLHEAQLRASAVPQHLWMNLCHKLSNQIFDAGEKFSLVLVEYDEDEEDRPESAPVWMLQVTASEGVQVSDVNSVYLVDHAWTYKVDVARQHLEQIPSLLHRMSVMMGIDVDNSTCEEQIDQVLQKMWRYNSTYTVNAGESAPIESQMPVWFVTDEIGSAITHSDDPNFRLVPFIHLPEQITYSLLIPLTDIEEGEFVTRDFVENLSEPGSKRREALLMPWQWKDFRSEDFSQSEPSDEYFQAGRVEESLPETTQMAPQIDMNRPLRVYSEYEYINKFLTDSAFELVDDEAEADILWLMTHFKAFKELCENSPNKFVNQFPFENVLTVKDLLSCICRRSVTDSTQQFHADTLEGNPKWLPVTYNLNTEMAKFVSYYQNREDKDLDNHWIVKPWNLARGLDMQITQNLAHILRLPTTGPKIAQKYVEDPVLFQRNDIAENGHSVKFDVRYVILLSSAEPLQAHVYRNFFLRFSNKEFSLDRFDDYEKHFTVMNYTDTAQLKHLPCADFLVEWEKQYPNQQWNQVEDKICDMLKEILENSVKKAPPKGLSPNLQSRSLYAADIILEWTKEREGIQPKILEINWMPDCARACNYYPEFYNDIFKLLFLGQPNDKVFRKL